MFQPARKFLADPAKDKRAKLVETLLKSPEFADLWAMRWADLLRVERAALGEKRGIRFTCAGRAMATARSLSAIEPSGSHMQEALLSQ